MCPLHGPGNDMNLCKVMMAQAKAMKSTWLTARRVYTGCVRFQDNKKRLAKVKELNALVANAVKEALKYNERLKSKDSSDSRKEENQEHFNFETLKIGEE